VPEAFTVEQKRRNVDYYEPLTVRDSSLSSATQAVLAAEVGYLSLAYDYAAEAALMDLKDLHANTTGGLHMASLAGGWTALVQGFGGMRQDDGLLSFRPALPEGIERLAFRLVRGDGVLVVEVKHTEVTYVWRRGSEPLQDPPPRRGPRADGRPAGAPAARAASGRDGAAPADGRAPARRRRT
jgi:alpha,alpha-trehalose phosphorylase